MSHISRNPAPSGSPISARPTPPPRRKPRRRRVSYPAGSPAAIKRMKRLRRRVMVLLVTLLLILLAIVFSTDVIFKVETLRIENPDGSDPPNTGIYSQEDIALATEITPGQALFAVDGNKLEDKLLVALPYLEEVEVKYSLPTTIVIQVTPAVESLYIPLEEGYAILSETLRVLRITDTLPDGLIELQATLGGEPQVGYSLDATKVEGEDQEANAETEAQNQTLAQALETLSGYLHQEDLYTRVSRIDLRDMENITVTISGRITIELGTLNNLDYKFQMVGTIFHSEGDDGLTENDVGVLDVSNSPNTGKAYYTPQ